MGYISSLSQKCPDFSKIMSGILDPRIRTFWNTVIAVSEWDMPGIEPGPLGWFTSAQTNEVQEVRQ
jgi:hypothetical protein